MGEKKDDRSLPQWIGRTLQGLAFWIGHRHALYHDHQIPEGALVAEACNLIQANLPFIHKSPLQDGSEGQ
jgi:hypothetical protein